MTKPTLVFTIPPKMVADLVNLAGTVNTWIVKFALGLELGDKEISPDELATNIEMLKNARLSWVCAGYRLDEIEGIVNAQLETHKQQTERAALDEEIARDRANDEQPEPVEPQPEYVL